ncbi:carbohydrate-binding module family 13 protein [Rhizophagus irregularis DAOM 181602=DAOM 197198]|nr:carbohydrate-binding module family 13 protein [Rhizophagus irregularis DAOM 181602=DAOM 197198]
MDDKFLPKLSQNLLEILNDEEYYDITIEVGNDPYKNDGNITHIKLPNILPETFQIILRYIYGGKVPLNELDSSDIIKVLIAANKLGLQEFYNLTSKEFLDKILPYEQILPKELYKDLLKAFISLSDPNSKPSDKSKPRIPKKIDSKNINSKIITFQHSELISKWIDRLEITDMLTSSYEFNLLFRSSRDGFNAKKFHECCDNQPRTVTIIKVKDSTEILGGYNPIEWKSIESYYYSYNITKDSFIFSFDNDRIENYILSRTIKEKKAIVNNFDFGPSFGPSDLVVWGWFGSYAMKDSYEKQIRKTKDNFTVEECEVFQIL